MILIILDKAICWCVWCCLWALVTGTLMTKPKTQAVTRGEPVVMECSTNLAYGVDWHFVSENGKKEEIYSSGVMSPIYESEYEIEKTNIEGVGVYNLVIESAAERHAGKYICIDDAGMGSDTASATLQIQDENVQNDSPAVETPDGSRCGTETDIKANETVVLVEQSTTIVEIPFTATASPIPLIVGLTVGLAVLLIVLIIILKFVCLRGRRVRRDKMVDEDSTQEQSFLATGKEKATNKNLHV